MDLPSVVSSPCRAPFLTAVGSVDRNLVAGLWCQSIQNSGGYVSGDGFLASFLRKEGFPGDPIKADIARGSSPGCYKTALSDIRSNQIRRCAEF